MFKDYKIAITGATSGMGLAAAKKFIDDGATVIAIGRSFAKVGDLGEKYIPCVCDVTKAEEIDKACRFISDTFGGELDTFVNAAGSGTYNKGVKDVTAADFDWGISLLLRAPVLFGKALYPMLLKSPQKNPSIVNIASSASRAISPDNIIYNLAKHDHVLYNKQQAAGFIGVRCNSVSPGFIDTHIFEAPGTDLSREAVLAMYEGVKQISPIPVIAEADEVADLILFLASTDAMYINGADVLIDGGLLSVISG